ncbi:MAG: hypothetical protein HQ495_04755 [Alphaproteobacteria bacterium]|nr:hypothetical protein [Alphaproteobacteria bacterium]
MLMINERDAPGARHVQIGLPVVDPHRKGEHAVALGEETLDHLGIAMEAPGVAFMEDDEFTAGRPRNEMKRAGNETGRGFPHQLINSINFGHGRKKVIAKIVINTRRAQVDWKA